MVTNFGPCKLIWHHTSKQMALEFISDEVQLTINVEKHSCDMHLECKFNNPDYVKEITKRLIKQLSKGKKARPLLMIANYGFASKKDSVEYHRTLPMVSSAIDDDAQKIIFLILPTIDKRE